MECNFLQGFPIDQTIRTNIRYVLVKKSMEQNFTKWLSQSNSINLIKKLIEDCKKPNISLSTPSPIFVSRSYNQLNQSQISNQQYSLMPPVSPNSSALFNYHAEKKNMLSESQIILEERTKKLSESISNSNLMFQHKNIIPQFYFPGGYVSQEVNDFDENLINKLFNKDELTVEEFTPITVELLDFPKMFNTVLLNKINIENKPKISKATYVKFHKENFLGKDPHRRLFNLLRQQKNNFLERKDFMPIMKALLEFHPGLEFLKVHPDFQEKYSETVAMRIFYSCDINDDEKITYREFKRSNILPIFRKVCEEPDINKIRDYFSYEHFYVIYCIFWELDTNEHDFLLDKEDFSKYDRHSLSRKAVDRIFNQIPRKFKSGHNDKMGFEDFLWFILCEEDKTSRTSIEYWFKVLDLDDNGIITPHEIKYFYDEQLHRMEYQNEETLPFNDFICMLHDMIKPEREFQYTIKSFLDNRQHAAYFFNNLLNLNKLLLDNHKDPFAKNEIDRNPEYTEWDKFAYYEYQRLTEEENEDNQESDESGIFDSNPNNAENANRNSDSDDLIASSGSGAER